jgi:UDP-N-acetylglucosamine:LPS N-acetylglucosamine transferase
MPQVISSGQATERPPGKRVLIVSAAIGAGHDATGRALEQAARRKWPDCDVQWLDILNAMGPGIAPVARAFYVLQIQRAPWLYNMFFWAIWKHRWYLASTRHLLGIWCGRRMARKIGAYQPDLIISTYPLGSAGLSWLRRRRGLNVPIGAWVSDFCPHPYWVYRDLDITYVMHREAVATAERAEPGARVAVGCLPVQDAFQPGSQDAARARLGLDTASFVVMLAVGSLGFGGIEHAVTAVLDADPGTVVVAACGRNERLRRRLETRTWPAGRVTVLGWTNDMPSWMNAADVIATNGGGVTVAEAIRCRRLLIMFDPIAGHGRANAALMASAGVALLCPKPADLAAAVGKLAGDATARAELLKGSEADVLRRAEDDLLDLAAMPVPVTARAWTRRGSAPRPA